MNVDGDEPADSMPGANSGPAYVRRPIFERAPRRFRRYLAIHNWQALFLAVLAFFAAALLWTLAYIGIYWFALLGATLDLSWKGTEGLDEIGNPRNLVGPHFPLYFAIFAVATLVVTAFVRKRDYLNRLREGRHYVILALAEFLFLLPNITISCWGNLRAIVWLGRRRQNEAWRLLRGIAEHDAHGLSLSSVGQEIGGTQKSQDRIIFALQLMGLISTRHAGADWTLVLASEEARAMFRPPDPPKVEPEQQMD